MSIEDAIGAPAAAAGPSRPGEFPYDAGIHPTGYTTKPWTIRQLAGLGDANDTNARFRYLLDRGETGLSLAFDLPTQMGLDPDDPRAEGEVGRAGVSIATVDDLAAVFAGIPLDRVSVSFTINATAPMVLAMWIVAAEESGVDPKALRGTLQNEMLKEHLARKAYIFDLDHSFRFSLDVIEHCVRHLPKVNPISISGGHAREAGADRGLEVACGIADAEQYLDGMLARGFTVDEVAPQFSFIYGAHLELLAEAAKFRAARRLYARRMAEHYGARNPRSMRMRIQVNTFGSTLAVQEPLNNIARTTVSALAAVLGGVQSLHVCAFDEAAQTPGELAARVALRVQQIMLTETDVARHVDPLGGSAVIEQLVDEIEQTAVDWLDRIAERGGLLASVRSGWLESVIEEMAFHDESGPRVGVRDSHEYAEEKQLLRDQHRTGVAAGRRRPFTRTDCTGPLERVRACVEQDENVLPALIEAARARATVGQMRAAVAAGIGGRNTPTA
ncbi:methylmalonyl-CoA mutase [Micromonospora sp. C31]|uniref:methylmalonyl-CoA mutase family protein n=1 Tax=Micromonospora sp. C31 TaxID=2824876 RepID=UPI001B39642B|nr:methylmalonyl-CoA mutase family protein [Micromonospora sp. C31]MBQ1075628.1 methylmalonyl-CoA mutase [Micromonospora sp. C31]